MVDDSDVGRRKELDREISSYISGLRKKDKRVLVDFLKRLRGKKKPQKAELHPEVSAYGQGEEKPKKAKEEEKEEQEMEEEFKEGAKKRTFWGWLKSMFASSEEYEEFEGAEEPEKEEYKKEEAAEEAPASELEEEYVEEVQRQGWVSRLVSRIFVKSREEEELEEASDEIAEDIQDMKTIAEIATKVMKMLPPEEMKKFKESDEFQIFKEILKKRELIK